MFSYVLPIRYCWAELKYDRILAVGEGVGVLSYDFSKFRKKRNLQYFQPDRYTDVYGGV